ncbi:hypothetical protein [Levilactobacillus namurensis]|uniref:hypothetical protein n=1 Tax=Levilactobacillus namurensis TaxID=380393 RepID=UPI0026EFCB2F|nr:hypothetical protein [Levilactobacillus namurensis]
MKNKLLVVLLIIASFIGLSQSTNAAAKQRKLKMTHITVTQHKLVATGTPNTKVTLKGFKPNGMDTIRGKINKKGRLTIRTYEDIGHYKLNIILTRRGYKTKKIKHTPKTYYSWVNQVIWTTTKDRKDVLNEHKSKLEQLAHVQKQLNEDQSNFNSRQNTLDELKQQGIADPWNNPPSDYGLWGEFQEIYLWLRDKQIPEDIAEIDHIKLELAQLEQQLDQYNIMLQEYESWR